MQTTSQPGSPDAGLSQHVRIATPPLADAIDDEISAVIAEDWWVVALRGVTAILFGVLVLLAPEAALLSLTLLFAGYLFADGVLGIVGAVRAARRNESWGLLLAESVLNILVGIAAVVFPVGAVFAFVIMTGVWAFVTGGLMVASAFELDRSHGKGWMILAGVVSLLFGVAIAISPAAGGVVLTWWFAGYAIAFGTLMLGLAFKLRGERRTGTDAKADRTRLEVKRADASGAIPGAAA